MVILKPSVDQAVVSDSKQWGGYRLTPLSIVSSPASMFYKDFEEIIPENVAYDASKQSEEGYWSPAWSWKRISDEAWTTAERDLRGIFILNTLLAVSRFSHDNQ